TSHLRSQICFTMSSHSKRRFGEKAGNSRQNYSSRAEVSAYEFLDEQENNTSESNDESQHVITSKKSMLYMIYVLYLLANTLSFLGKGKDKKTDTKKTNRNIIDETPNMNVPVNVYSDDTHVSDDDKDLSNTSPITAPMTLPPFREKAND